MRIPVFSPQGHTATRRVHSEGVSPAHRSAQRAVLHPVIAIRSVAVEAARIAPAYREPPSTTELRALREPVPRQYATMDARWGVSAIKRQYRDLQASRRHKADGECLGGRKSRLASWASTGHRRRATCSSSMPGDARSAGAASAMAARAWSRCRLGAAADRAAPNVVSVAREVPHGLIVGICRSSAFAFIPTP